LVLALRDYLLERAERRKSPSASSEVARQRRISSVLKEDDSDTDPEADISELPDGWMAAYLHVKHLRNLERR
jgi:hypothetical protein